MYFPSVEIIISIVIVGMLISVLNLFLLEGKYKVIIESKILILTVFSCFSFLSVFFLSDSNLYFFRIFTILQAIVVFFVISQSVL